MILVTAISALDYGVDMSVINLTHDIIDQFKKHGESDYPHECCGFILGSFKDTASMGVEYMPASNTKEENRERRFLIDPMAYQKAEDKADERDLSVISIVQRGRCARSLSLGSYVLLGKGAESSGGRDSESILADVYEALIASIFLDQGYERARKLVLVNLAHQLNTFDHIILAPNDPKSQLQEYLQSQGSTYPIYRTVSSQGPDHDPTFTILVLSDKIVLGTGQGKKKSDAERAAARDALVKIGI